MILDVNGCKLVMNPRIAAVQPEELMLNVPSPAEWAIPLELVTPMWAGGVETGTLDSFIPIRPTAIRGSLRRFWRLLNVNRFADQYRCREAENKFWGSTDQASGIRLSIEQIPKLTTEQISFDKNHCILSQYFAEFCLSSRAHRSPRLSFAGSPIKRGSGAFPRRKTGSTRELLFRRYQRNRDGMLMS